MIYWGKVKGMLENRDTVGESCSNLSILPRVREEAEGIQGAFSYVSFT